MIAAWRVPPENPKREYIDREAFLADKKWLYCTECDKRKGKNRGKIVTLYEIGEAPCKSCGIHDMLEEVEDYPAADVRPVVRGRWTLEDDGCLFYRCSACGKAMHGWFAEIYAGDGHYCPNCGAEMEGTE